MESSDAVVTFVSIASIFLLKCCERQTARLAVVTVFPTPPFGDVIPKTFPFRFILCFYACAIQYLLRHRPFYFLCFLKI